MANKKIFVSIAAFEDTMILDSVKRLLETAKNPDNIVFGFALNYKNYPDFSQFKNKIYIIKDSDFNFPGIVKMRNEIRKLITDEEYFLSLDAHTFSLNDWDSKLIYDLEELKSINDKVIISAQIGTRFEKNTSYTEWRTGGHWSVGWGLDGHSAYIDETDQRITKNMVNDKYFINRYVSCNFIFMKTEDVIKVNFPGYHGFPWEEVEQSITCYCHGYDVVAPLIGNTYILRDIDIKYSFPLDETWWDFVGTDRNDITHWRKKWILDSVEMQIQVEKLLLTGKNDYYSLENAPRSIYDFYESIGCTEKYLDVLCTATEDEFKIISRDHKTYSPYKFDKV